jgi:hypothetical protein
VQNDGDGRRKPGENGKFCDVVSIELKKGKKRAIKKRKFDRSIGFFFVGWYTVFC